MVVGQRGGTGYVLATDGVHVGKGKVNPNYQIARDITGNHANLLLVASKEIRTARPQQMTAPSALWGTATLSIFRQQTTVYASICQVLYSCTSRVQAGPSKPEVRYMGERSDEPLTRKVDEERRTTRGISRPLLSSVPVSLQLPRWARFTRTASQPGFTVSP